MQACARVLVLLCVLVQAATPAVAPLVLRIVVGLGEGLVTQSACVAGQCDQATCLCGRIM